MYARAAAWWAPRQQPALGAQLVAAGEGLDFGCYSTLKPKLGPNQGCIKLGTFYYSFFQKAPCKRSIFSAASWWAANLFCKPDLQSQKSVPKFVREGHSTHKYKHMHLWAILMQENTIVLKAVFLPEHLKRDHLNIQACSSISGALVQGIARPLFFHSLPLALQKCCWRGEQICLSTHCLRLEVAWKMCSLY